MLKMVDGTGIIGVDMVCPLGGAVSPPQPPNYDNIEMEGVGSLMLPNSLKAPLERLELLGNSVQGENPAPDNPQEIKSVGRKSKNLFNIADLRVGQVQKDGTINEKQIYYRTVILDVPQDGKYRITFNSNDDYTMLYFTEAYANGAYSKPYIRVQAGNPNYYITLEKGKNILSFSTHTASGNIAFTTDHNIMIAAESETLDYEPYGYFLDVKVTGKNLFSNKPTDWMIGKGLSWSTYPNDPISIYRVINSAVNVINLKPSTTYSIVNNSEKIVISRMIERNLSENGIKDHDVRHSKYTFVTNQNTMNAILQFKKVDGTELLSSDIESNKIMLVEGEANENTPYEPCTEQSVQIALNEPLRGIGEYNDTITKDGVVRKIKRIVFDGSEDEKWVINNERENVIRFIPHQFGDAIKINDYQRSMIDKLKWVSGVWNRDEVGQDMFAGILRINMPKTLTPDLQTFKTWLSQNPLTVDYVLAEPVTEPLPESVQDQLSALHSENGTTHVFVDSGEVPCGIKLTYRKEK